MNQNEHIGNFDRRITFQKASGTTNVANEDSEVWANLASVPTMWALVKESTGKEILQSEQMDVVQPTTFRIRYRADITEKMRVVYNTHPYYIEGLTEIGRHEYLDIRTRVDKEQTI